MPRDRDHLADILGAARAIEEYVHGVTREQLDADNMRFDATVRELEIMGEGVKRLSDEYKAGNPEVPWRQMAGMRDVLIHAYDHVDPDEVWAAATVEVPKLLTFLRSIEPPLREEDQ